MPLICFSFLFVSRLLIHLEKREGGTAVEMLWRCLDPEGGGFKADRPVHSDLPAERGREDLLQCGGKTAAWVPLQEQLHRHVGAGGGGLWSTQMSRTHWSGDTAHPRSLWEQGGPHSTVIRFSQRIRLHPPQVGRDHHDQTPCATPCCRPDPGLSLSRSSNIWVAQAGGWDNHRLHHLGNLVFPCNEHAGEVSWARAPGPKNTIRDPPATNQGLYAWPDSHHRVCARKLTHRFRFNIEGKQIPTISEKPEKSLGKVFNSKIKDSCVQSVRNWTAGWEQSTSLTSQASSKRGYTSMVFFHGHYGCCLSTKSPCPLWRLWRGRSAAVSGDGWGCRAVLATLHSMGTTQSSGYPWNLWKKNSRLHGPKSQLMYRDSRDPKVAQAEVVVKTGRKWNAQAAVLDAESRLCQKDLVGVVARGRVGLGLVQTPWCKDGKGGGRFRRKWGLQRRREDPAERRVWASRGPGQGGRRPWTGKSHGRTSGRLSHTATLSWFRIKEWKGP